MKIAAATRDAARLIHDGALVLARMSRNGVRIDVGYLHDQIASCEREIEEIKARMATQEVWEWMKRAYRNKADLGSREQIAHVVFGLMGHKRGRSLPKKNRNSEWGERTKPKLDEAAFSLCNLEYVRDFFRWKKLEKLLTTYFYDIRRNLVRGRIHPHFGVNRIVSYRSSSSEPNLQNIPSRNKEIAPRVRKCFIPDDGCDFVDWDYQLAEVRSACVYTKDPRLISDFTLPGKDAHGDTAELWLGCKKPDDDAPSAWKKAWKDGPRDWTKNRFVFPQFFGSTYHNCGPHIWDEVEKGKMMFDGSMTIKQFLHEQGITRLGDPEDDIPAKNTFLYRVMKAEESFWKERFKVYGEWKVKWFHDYCKNGYCTSLSGFVYQGLLSRNDVTNYPIQGFAFHWNLLACILAQEEIDRIKMPAMFWNEIHDSNIANVKRGHVQDYCSLMHDIMTKRVPDYWRDEITVRLAATVEVCPDGSPWAAKQEWVQKEGGLWAKA